MRCDPGVCCFSSERDRPRAPPDRDPRAGGHAVAAAVFVVAFADREHRDPTHGRGGDAVRRSLVGEPAREPRGGAADGRRGRSRRARARHGRAGRRRAGARPDRPRSGRRPDGRSTRTASCSRSCTAAAGTPRSRRPTGCMAAFADDPQVRLGGGAIASRQVTAAIQRDLRRAELIAFPLVLLLSFWVFRGLVAAFLPPLVGAGAIALTFLGLRVAVEVHSLSVFALNLVTGLGLGLAIDYSLFIVSRWREEAARHGHGPEALAATMRSAGRTVVFSALTVAASMACLLVFPQQFLYSMGVGGVLVALSAGLVALVPLPAFLYWLGPRIDALAPRRLQQVPVRRPLGAPRGVGDAATGPRRRRLGRQCCSCSRCRPSAFTSSGVDATTLPSSASSRQVAEALDREGIRGRYAPDHRDHGCPASSGGGRASSPRQPGAGGGAACAGDRTGPLAARSPPARQGPRRELAAARPHRAVGAARGTGHRADGSVRRPAGIARRAPAVGARDPRAHDVHVDLPLHRLGRAAAQVARS